MMMHEKVATFAIEEEAQYIMKKFIEELERRKKRGNYRTHYTLETCKPVIYKDGSFYLILMSVYVLPGFGKLFRDIRDKIHASEPNAYLVDAGMEGEAVDVSGVEQHLRKGLDYYVEGATRIALKVRCTDGKYRYFKRERFADFYQSLPF